MKSLCWRRMKLLPKNITGGEIPFIYRVHPQPEEDRVMELGALLTQMGHPLKGARNGRLHSRAVQELLESLKGEPEEGTISRMVLRSMKQARYSSEPENGHFGLAAEYYCHFTSPIRRYPDLMVHRMIRTVLRDRAGQEDLAEKEAVMDAVASRCSFTERARTGRGAGCGEIHESAVYVRSDSREV